MSKISEKLKAVATAVAAIEKQFGRGAVMQLGGDAVEQKVPVIPSGSVGLDKAFGIGGYPRGRAVEIFGNESSGKTTLARHLVGLERPTSGHIYIDGIDLASLDERQLTRTLAA